MTEKERLERIIELRQQHISFRKDFNADHKDEQIEKSRSVIRECRRKLWEMK